MYQLLDMHSILKTLYSHKTELKGFGVNRIGLFGSYCNNEMHPNTDIDFLVELEIEIKLLETSWH